MIERIKGTIVSATAIEQFTRKDGSVSESATLHIQQVSNEPYPQEVALKVTGDLAQYAKCINMEVEAEYIVRVFTFMKGGKRCLGNDIYARSIRKAGTATEEGGVA